MPESGLDPTALAVIAGTPRLLRDLLSSVPERARERINNEGWSPKHVVAHLLDVEGIAFRERISRIVSENRPFIRSIDPSARLEESGYLERPLEALLEELEMRRAEDIGWLRSLDAAALARTGEHDEAGEISAANIANYWACHDLLHLRQIAGMLQTGLMDKLGNLVHFLEEA